MGWLYDESVLIQVAVFTRDIRKSELTFNLTVRGSNPRRLTIPRLIGLGFVPSYRRGYS